MTQEQDWQTIMGFLQPKSSPYWVEEPSLTQKVFLRSDAKEVLFGGMAGGGKLVTDSELLTTPSGFVEAKNIKVGDLVAGRDGRFYNVLAISERQIVPGWRFEFDDGSTVVTNDEHLWLTYDYKERTQIRTCSDGWREQRRSTRTSRATFSQGERKSIAVAERNKVHSVVNPAPTGTVRTTKEIVNTLTCQNGRANHAIPVAETLVLPEVELPIDPYLLGCWLGDGSSHAGQITGMDNEIHEVFANTYQVGATQQKGQAWTTTYLGLQTDLRHLGVLNNKHVPHEYLWSSEEQRLALLQGLMDTDGTVAKNSVEFVNTNKALVDAVAHLARSLGMKVGVREGVSKLYGKVHGPKWLVKFSANRYVFRLPRKVSAQQISSRQTNNFRYIKRAERVPAQPMRCFKVSAPDELFLVTEHFIPTHNSSALIMAAMQYPLALDTDVLTTSGWKTIGTLNVGDYVFGMDGRPSQVTHKTVPEFLESSKVVFRCGETVVASDDHLWLAHDFKDRMSKTPRPPQTVSTSQIGKTLKTPHKKSQYNWSVPVAAALSFPHESQLPLDPYTMGVWLGDGCSKSGTIAIYKNDHATASLIESKTGMLGKRYDDYQVHFSGLRTKLNEAGVFGNKHIPDSYMYASVESRLELLRGLMDSDGTVCVYGDARFFQKDAGLASQVADLARSLGCRVVEGTQTVGPTVGSYVQIYSKVPVFNLERKIKKQKLVNDHRERMIHDVVPVGKTPVQCITVDNNDSAFLITKSLIPTHNCDVPGYSGILFRRTYADLSLPGALMDRFTEWISNHDDIHWNANQYTATFPSGGRITFGYLNNVNDYQRYKSSEFQFIGMDEVTEIREFDYRYMFSRLRRPKTGPLSQVPLRMRCATNPAPNWVRQRFLVEGRKNGRLFIPSSMTDNPGIDVESYRSMLQELDPVERNRLEFGDWWATSLGTMFDRTNVVTVTASDLPVFSKGAKKVRLWDLAGTEPSPINPDPDWTAGCLGVFDQGIFWILDFKHIRAKGDKIERLIAETAEHDGIETTIRMEQEPGSAGKNLIDQYARKILPGYDFQGIRATGDKATRAKPLASAVANGNVRILEGSWNTEFLDEIASFPEAAVHDDMVDAAVHAFNFTAGIEGLQRRKLEIIV